MLPACEGCLHYKMCRGTACIAERRHIIDAVVTVNVTEPQLLEVPICMLHRDTRKRSFPTNVKATVQYGENLQASFVALNTVGAVSVKRTHEILSGVFNIPIASGTISNMVKRCADAVCCVHLLRELAGIAENHPRQKWAVAFIDILLEMKKIKDKAVEAGKESLGYYHYHKFDKRYNELIKQARGENPLPLVREKKRGQKKKGKILVLVERLDNYKASVCFFIHNFKVPFDNNQAERDIG